MDREPPPTEAWADERVIVGCSLIEGGGLFTTADIDAGTVLLRFGGRLVNTPELSDLIAGAEANPGAPFVDTITVYEGVHLVLPPGSVLHFGNHSCDPNLWHVGPYELAARRDVVEGEELTLDYGTSSGAEGFVMECHCASVRCRGRVTSEDWRLLELRACYEGHWTPALQQRIDRT